MRRRRRISWPSCECCKNSTETTRRCPSAGRGRRQTGRRDGLLTVAKKTRLRDEAGFFISVKIETLRTDCGALKVIRLFYE